MPPLDMSIVVVLVSRPQRSRNAMHVTGTRGPPHYPIRICRLSSDRRLTVSSTRSNLVLHLGEVHPLLDGQLALAVDVASVLEQAGGDGGHAVRRVDRLLPPGGMADRAGEECLHALDGDGLGLGNPDECEDAATSMMVQRRDSL